MSWTTEPAGPVVEEFDAVTAEAMIESLVSGWLNAHLDEFNHVFASVELNEIIDKDAAWTQLAWYAFAFLGLVVVQFAARFGDGYLFQILGNKAVLDLRQKTYAHIQQQPLRFFDKNPVGRLVTRVTSDVEAIGEVFASGFVQLAGDAIIIVGALTLMFLLSWQLALIVVLAIPVMGFLTWLFRGRARSAFRDMRVKLASVNSFLNETIQGWRVTRIFGTEKRMEYTAIGDSVNTAKRIQENSQGGQILISAEAYALLGPQVEVRLVDPIHAKGKSRPVQVFEVLGLSA